ncbi:hypothetical protein [Ramlibacter sp.]|uniref:hypothetical protein n=1 Tax=Ramlibacter sp. TaxID=1917967 RepID=UPI0035B378F1
MTLLVDMNPLLAHEVERAARRAGISPSQFIVKAVEDALRARGSYAQMLAIQAEEEARFQDSARQLPEDRPAGIPGPGMEQPYETEASRKSLLERLRRKHGVHGA